MKFWLVHLKKLPPQFGRIVTHELKRIWFCSKSIWKQIQRSSFIDITLAFGANPDSLEVYMQTWLTMGLPFISDLLPDLMSMEALYTLCCHYPAWPPSRNLMFFFSCISASEQKKRMTSVCFKIKAESTLQVKKYMCL